MEFELACDQLGLSENHTPEMLKRAYYRRALKHHPDKGGDTEKFKEINKAYRFLLKQNGELNYSENYDHTDYSFLLKKAVHWFDPDGKWDERFINTSFKSILLHCENASIEIFKKLSVEKSIKFLNIITKWELIFQLKKETVLKMHEILETKMNSNIVVLDVSLKDILEDKIYKYESDDGDDYYIPLWHKFFQLKNVTNVTTLRNCKNECFEYFFTIKDNNDIHIKLDINIQELFDKGFYEVKICNFEHKIHACELKIKKNQIYIIKNQGIAKVNKKSLYDTTNRADIYLDITLF